MKNIYCILILFFFSTNSFSENNIVYLDMQYIIDKSKLGEYYKKELGKINKKNNSKLEVERNILKKKETELNNQKNILSNDKIKIKLEEINKLIKDYNILKNQTDKSMMLEKKKYTSEILKIVNPLITEYVKNNGITLVLEKKNILVGVKSLDVTNIILDMFNNEVIDKKLINDN